MHSTPVDMTALNELSLVAGDQLAAQYLERLNSIHAHPREDIAAVLQRFSKDPLSELHRAMCTKASEKFETLRNRRPIKRTAIGTLVTDIVALGYSIANDTVSRDAEKAFQLESVEPRASQEDHALEYAELLRVVAALSTRLSSVEKELAELKATTSSPSSVTQVLTSTPEDDSDEDAENEDRVSENEWQTVEPHRRRGTTNASQSSLRGGNNPQESGNRTAEQPTADRSAAQSHRPVAAAADASSEQAHVTTTTLRAATNGDETEIYVGNIQPSNTVDDIRKHIRGMGINDEITVRPLRKTGHQRSFKVLLPRHHKGTVLAKQRWPEHVPFIKQQPNQRQEARTSARNRNADQHGRNCSGRHRRPLLRRTLRQRRPLARRLLRRRRTLRRLQTQTTKRPLVLRKTLLRSNASLITVRVSNKGMTIFELFCRTQT